MEKPGYHSVSRGFAVGIRVERATGVEGCMIGEGCMIRGGGVAEYF